METSDTVSTFMATMALMGGIVVQERPRIDLDLYIQNYTGHTRFDRLLLIGKCSVVLCVEALKAAVIEAKTGKDVSRYRVALEHLMAVAPNEPEAEKDDAWMERTEKENAAETARLEGELKRYKNNLIKESIRKGHEDLGTHFEKIGKMKEAYEAYGKMRPDATMSNHIDDCAMRLAMISLHRRDFTLVASNISKINGTPTDQNREKLAGSRTALGIALLELGRYESAATEFLHAPDALPPKAYNQIISPNDIAIYGGLLALATFSREKLRKDVLDNTRFRTFLEHEPHIRKAVSHFLNGRYSNCLSILEASRPDFLLDIYLQKHVSEIFSRIRSKCIVQYLIPFSCVTLKSLESVFAPSGASLETELAKMIQEGAFNARIDSKSKLLVAVRPDARVQMQQETLQVTESYEREAKERLRRISIVASGLNTFVGTRRSSGSGSSFDEDWCDDNNGTTSDQVGEAIMD